MGSEFVLGFIQAMDGEKDPRNLVIALNSIQRIILHLPFGETGLQPTKKLKLLQHLFLSCRGAG